MALTPTQFAERWRGVSLSERSAAQSHFLDLCEMLGEPHPAAADSVGERYTFEKPVNRTSGRKGFADVWLRDHFAWEYKGKHKDLKAAYRQLNDYREDLGNPPLLVVCDLDRFEIHTNFTASNKRVYAFNLDELNSNQVTATCPLPPLEVLRALFGDYNVLRPDRTDARVTQEVAKVFCRLAERLEIEKRSYTKTPINTKEEIAHFLMRILFCLFADSIGLLPKHLFRELIQGEDRFSPKRFLRKLTALFEAMSNPDGIFGEHTIKYFNGGLFNSKEIIDLDRADLAILYEVSKNYDWSHIAPEIFGTVFERSLNEERRSLIGAHYTSAEDILLLIEPVLMQPLEQEWANVRASILQELQSDGSSARATARRGERPSTLRAHELLENWINKLTQIKVLDPACGSGNFLYLALRRMLGLWLEAHRFANEHKISMVLPAMVSPRQLYGIETEFLAHELASIVVWIGYLQWKHEHGIPEDREPILQKLDNIQHADAIMRYDDLGKPYEPEWPQVDFVIGNPPFLGGKSLRRELGDSYVEELFDLYRGRVKAEADLVVYWFEKSRALLTSGTRVGLLATQSIRQGANRAVLARILESGNIFWAWSDREWVLEGAAVRISMVGFDNGREVTFTLNGEPATQIHSNLTTGLDLTNTGVLEENSMIAFQGPVKVGRFELDYDSGQKLLRLPNVHRKPNSDVIKPWLNGNDITDRPLHRWIIDFGLMNKDEAALYEGPFEHLRKVVYPSRRSNRDRQRRENWWRLGRSGGSLKNACSKFNRMIVTSRVSKHRFFVWVQSSVVPDTRVVAITKDSDYFMGVLHSATHLEWVNLMSSRHGVGNDPTYNTKTCFETFAFPYPPGSEPPESRSTTIKAIADASRELIRLRDEWLNPPNTPKAELRKRTLTNLYNQRPAWLEHAHETLDRAVFAAYGWSYPLSRDEILRRLLELNHERAAGIIRAPSHDLPPKKSPGVERPTRQPAAKIARSSA